MSGARHALRAGMPSSFSIAQLGRTQRILSVDIDGTIADVTKRKQYALKYGADGTHVFYEVFLDGKYYHMDDPVIASRDFLNQYISNVGGQIVYLSGRREGTEGQTQNWLTAHEFPRGHIIHRRKGLRSAKFKSHWINEFKRIGSHVDAHIGDRLEDDGGAAKECNVRFVHIVDHEWPSFESFHSNSR